MNPRGFGSDNHAPVHPDIMAALTAVNLDHAASYGTDPTTLQLESWVRNTFGNSAQMYCVFNGTGANVLALRSVARETQAVLVSSISHLFNDECGAPERMAGVKLLPLPHENGKLSLQTLKEALIRRGDQHFSQISGLSLTQPTELGTCYSLSEIHEITAWARANHLFVHLDGARLGQAKNFLNCSWQELVAGADIISLGGTKNGLMMGELVILLGQNSDVSSDLPKYFRKQIMQLPSKTRYISAQFLVYLLNGVAEQVAAHSHLMAKKLAEALSSCKSIQILRPVQSNAVFAIIPKPLIKPLRAKYFFYVFDEKTFECRLMTSWDTQEQDVLDFADYAKTLESQGAI